MAAGSGLPHVVVGTLDGTALGLGATDGLAEGTALGAADADGAAEALATGDGDAAELGEALALALALALADARGLADAPGEAIAVGSAELGALDTAGVADAFAAAATKGATGAPVPEQPATKMVAATNPSAKKRKARDVGMVTLLWPTLSLIEHFLAC